MSTLTSITGMIALFITGLIGGALSINYSKRRTNARLERVKAHRKEQDK